MSKDKNPIPDKTPRPTAPDDRGLISEKVIKEFSQIATHLGRSEAWKSRCYDKEPALMDYAEEVHYSTVNQLGRRLQGLFAQHPFFAVLIHKHLMEAFLFGLYMGERRSHLDPHNMVPVLDYPEPKSPEDDLPPDEDPKIDSVPDDIDLESDFE